MALPIVRPNQTQTPVVQEPSQWTPEQMALITSVVAPGATPNELKLFLYRCDKMGLDPLKAGQIFFIKYGNNPGTIVVGIEGFRSRASRTGKLKGIKRGVLRNADGQCIGAWAKVKHADWDEWAEAEVSFEEYSTGKAGWTKMPETMIQKCAEAAALRMAFPDELGDAYAPEEMDKKALEPKPIVSDPLPAADGVQLESYAPKYGRFAKKHLENCDPIDLRDEIEKIEAEAKQAGRPIVPWKQEFIKNAEPLVQDYELLLAAEMRESGNGQ